MVIQAERHPNRIFERDEENEEEEIYVESNCISVCNEVHKKWKSVTGPVAYVYKVAPLKHSNKMILIPHGN